MVNKHVPYARQAACRTFQADYHEISLICERLKAAQKLEAAAARAVATCERELRDATSVLFDKVFEREIALSEEKLKSVCG